MQQYSGNLIETLISIATKVGPLPPREQAAYDVYSYYADIVSVTHDPAARKLCAAAWKSYERVRQENEV